MFFCFKCPNITKKKKTVSTIIYLTFYLFIFDYSQISEEKSLVSGGSVTKFDEKEYDTEIYIVFRTGTVDPGG